MSIQQALNNILSSAARGAGAMKIKSAVEEQTASTKEQTKAVEKSTEQQAEYIKELNKRLEEQKVEEAAKEQEYQEKELENTPYSSPEQKFRWEEEAAAEKYRDILRGKNTLNGLEPRLDFLSNFSQDFKTRESIILDQYGKPMEVKKNGK